jgi:hypothetical protein
MRISLLPTWKTIPCTHIPSKQQTVSKANATFVTCSALIVLRVEHLCCYVMLCVGCMMLGGYLGSNRFYWWRNKLLYDYDEPSKMFWSQYSKDDDSMRKCAVNVILSARMLCVRGWSNERTDPARVRYFFLKKTYLHKRIQNPIRWTLWRNETRLHAKYGWCREPVNKQTTEINYKSDSFNHASKRLYVRQADV